ncbi:Centrosomal protein [Amphibalanus amphitrite]|uniref:Centrosomal protein n=1 Tax=Amphibalanus amphitrite TaxID=1232801 RepID=A0A6A4WEM6_AMPAM|nr:Centrosomal protein [Amphibalanus amphitrite]
MAESGELCSQLSDLAELSELPELRSVAELSPVSDLFPDAELCVAELSPMAHLPSADLEAAIELDMLETTRGPLLWTGTAVGGGDSRPLSLRNNSDSETLSIALEIADGSVFQFQGDQPGRTLELTLPPATERRVPVLFAPPAADCYRDSVLVRKAAQPTGLAAVIPLCGYGGAANIQVCLNTRQPTAGLTLLLNMTAPDGSLLAGLMVANRGPRAAYVRLFVCTDTTCRERVPDGAATALPARCVVAAGETQQLTVAVPPSQPAAATGLAVSVLCGDEVLRRELRHAWPTGAPALQRPRGFLQLTDFQVRVLTAH